MEYVTNTDDIASHSYNIEDNGNHERHQKRSDENWKRQTTYTIYHPRSKVLNGCTQYADNQ